MKAALRNATDGNVLVYMLVYAGKTKPIRRFGFRVDRRAGAVG